MSVFENYLVTTDIFSETPGKTIYVLTSSNLWRTIHQSSIILSFVKNKLWCHFFLTYDWSGVPMKSSDWLVDCNNLFSLSRSDLNPTRLRALVKKKIKKIVKLKQANKFASNQYLNKTGSIVVDKINNYDKLNR